MKNVLKRCISLLTLFNDESNQISTEYIRDNISSYRHLSDSAFKRSFERDKVLLREMGYNLDYINDKWSIDEGYNLSGTSIIDDIKNNQNINFDKLFDYYEHNGNKEYDLENDGWIVDLESDYHRQSEFDAMFSELESRDYPATSVLLVKNGTLVYEKYYDDFSYNTVFNTYSVTKSFTSALVGIAIDKGLILSLIHISEPTRPY